ncbi:MAG: hypothetical protein AB2L22_17920 [Syntrophales bacterium]
MATGINLVYKLKGSCEDGVDVFELSPILLYIGKLIHESHKALYPDDKELAINIRPFEKGSFDINIVMYAKDLLQQVLDFLNSDTGKNATLLLAYLGFTSQFSGINLMQLISWLKGKKLMSVEPLQSGEIRYNSEDDNYITISKPVDTLYQNCNIRNYIFPAVGRPLEIKGVDSVESFIKQDEETTKVIYDKGIVPAIKEYSSREISVHLPTDETIENRMTVWVRPVKANLEGGSTSWSFRIGKDQTLTAHITDKNFLEDIKNNVIRLANSDRLKVEILQKQTVREGDTPTTTEITKVIEYVKGPEQLKIPNN